APPSPTIRYATPAAAPPVEKPRTARDRRCHPRVGARGVAGHLQTASGVMAGLPVENISLGGLFVRSQSPLALGTQMTILLFRSGFRRPIQVIGQVVSAVSPEQARQWGAMAGMGIRFDQMDGDAPLRLRMLIDELGGASARPAAPPPPAPVATLAPAPATASPRSPELTLATEMLEAQSQTIQDLHAQIKALRKEISVRDRAINELTSALRAEKATRAALAEHRR
ncbi:MAG: PilZ domain-containing protein, partial [Byssovorax sp.]